MRVSAYLLWGLIGKKGRSALSELKVLYNFYPGEEIFIKKCPGYGIPDSSEKPLKGLKKITEPAEGNYRKHC